MTTTMTPEQHTTELSTAIDREIDRYGVPSLADFCASTISSRCDEDRLDFAYWTAARRVFEQAAEQLQALERQHGHRYQSARDRTAPTGGAQ